MAECDSEFRCFTCLSLTKGIFLKELKIDKILPLFKSGDNKLICNFRPVSVLSLCSKIFEKIMCSRVMSFITKHNILFYGQFGFRKNHNTTMALIILTDKIMSAINNVNMLWELSWISVKRLIQ